jgi:hypothetical protein
MAMKPTVTPLPRFWRGLFFIEIPLVAFTLALWVFQPDTYLHDAIGITTPGEAERFLLRLSAGTVASLILAFYGWLLIQPTVHLPTFRAYQVCLGIGDVFIIAASLMYWPANQQHDALIAQIAMACFWGLIRIIFLIRTRS